MKFHMPISPGDRSHSVRPTGHWILPNLAKELNTNNIMFTGLCSSAMESCHHLDIVQYITKYTL
jgi:hypothetical protein